MNATRCACRTSALRIFISSLIGPPTTQQWRRLSGLPGRPSNSANIARYALRPIARRPLVVAALQPDRQAHSSLATDGASAAVGGVELAAPPASTDPVSMVEPGGTTRQQAVTGAQMPGKHKRKKLRKQQEAEAARAALGATAETSIASEAAAGEAPVAGDSIIHEELPEDTAAGDAGAEPAEKKRVKKPRWTDAQRAERRLASSAGLRSEPSWSESSEPSDSSRSPRSPRSPRPSPSTPPPRIPSWKIQKRALQDKFPDGWQPRKRLSPDALEGIRALHRQFPDVYTTPALAKHFMVSAEVVRRILKSKWQPQPAEEEDRQERWFRRGKQVWARWAALGRKPPKRWQAEGIRRDSSWAGRRQRQLEGGEGVERVERGRDEEENEREGDERTRKGGSRVQTDEREEAAAGRSRRSAELETDRPRRGRTQSLGRKMRLQREPQNDESESSAWLFAKGPGDE